MSPRPAQENLDLDALAETSLTTSREEPGPPSALSPQTLRDFPERLDEYRLLAKLGSGAMGSVFEAHDMFLDRRVAIKFINAGLLSSAAHERFLREARAVARLHHPNIIVVHRIGKHDGRWYLVSELVRGQSLDRLEKPVPPAQAMRIARDLARGLGAAHRRGVLHRDIKPANAILADTGEVKLLDFGLAKLLRTALDDSDVAASAGLTEQSLAAGLSQAGVVLGTPLYMALEILRGQRATVRSDIYALGALLYELSAGVTPYQARGLMQLAFLVAETDPRPVAELAPDLPAPYAALIDRCLRRDPAARPASCEELVAILEDLLSPEQRPAALPEGNPYRGLRPFEAEHRGLFFGRSLEVQELLDRLRSDALVLLCGDSGVGKSSLCRAGLLPAITGGALQDGRRWSALHLTPGARPLSTLSDTLSGLCDLSQSEVASRICDEPGAVIQALVRKQGEDRGVVLFMDQLEELVTQGDRDEAARVAELLGHLSVLVPGVRLVMTGRIDFLARLAALPGLGRELEKGLYIVRPLSEEGLREAITGPASRLGYSFESDALVNELVRAAAAAEGGLPLLQFALSELWWARDQEGHVIPARALAQIGGVTGALARHADAVIAEMSAEQRRCARRLLSRLITEEGTRATRTQSELIGADPDALAALEGLIKGRLLVAREGSGEGTGTYEIAHEALLTGWETLRRWLVQDEEDRAARARLDRAAAEWARLQRADEALFTEAQLRELSPSLLEGLSAQEEAFVRASQQAARRRRWRVRALVASLPVLLLLFYGGVRLREERLLAGRVQAHLGAARAALQAGRDGAVSLSSLQASAFARFDGHQPEEGERLFQQAVGLFGEVEGRLRLASREVEAALVLDRGGPVSKRLFAEVLFEQARLLDHATAPYGRAQQEDLIQRLRTYDDGVFHERLFRPAQVSLRTSPPGAQITLRSYKEREGRHEPSPPTPLGVAPLTDAALPPGSYLLELSLPGRPSVRLPLATRSGERLALEVPLPPSTPEGYVYVPPGRFLYGAGSDEALRRLYGTVQPRHEVQTGGYLIGRTEVTFADWLAYLRDLPAEERKARLLQVGREHMTSKLALRELPGGGFELTMALIDTQVTLREGEPLRYQGRKRNRSQDWRRLPVTGMSYEEAQGYAAWLDRSGRLRGARLCGEHEWERAARGADGRMYPHGEVLRADDANHDATYGREPRSFGPDEVGSHPASDSPFGVADMAGNVWEWTRSAVSDAEVVYRGGGWYQGGASARSINRELGEKSMRDTLVGMRICANWP